MVLIYIPQKGGVLSMSQTTHIKLIHDSGTFITHFLQTKVDIIPSLLRTLWVLVYSGMRSANKNCKLYGLMIYPSSINFFQAVVLKG